MSDAKNQAARLASTIPSDLLPTVTCFPRLPWPIDLSQSQSQPADISCGHLSRLDIKSKDDSEKASFDFSVGALIGSGGFGIVHSAEQSCLNREVAIKRVRPDRRSAAAEEQLQREAHLMGRLEHPAIPPAYLIGMGNDKEPVLVMRWIRGVPWNDKLAEFPSSEGDGLLRGAVLRNELNSFIRICEAVAFSHGQGIIHRDIKPSNIVIGQYGEVYLLDWGISVELQDDGVYNALGFAGTPCFAAPEMLSRAPKLDARTDVYLLGSTLYNIVTGYPPHQGETTEEVFERILTSPMPTFAEGWPDALKMLCRKAMEADPNDRYASARAMLEDLRYVIEYGELTELEADCDQDLNALIEMAEDRNKDISKFNELGTRCRFGLERILHEWPSNTTVARNLEKCLYLLCNAAISQQRIAAARSIMVQYRELAGDTGADRADVMRHRIDALADQLIAKGDELSMNIQVQLIERLAAKEQEYDELMVAYKKLCK
ncbi:MAG: serine/threonine-protein kinase [Phycisphaerales bacterium]|nr:serine/threonine-protein kinase [Phycisphaerales bacterium]